MRSDTNHVPTTNSSGFDMAGLRREHGYKASEIARQLGVTPQAYADFERNARAGKLSLGRFQQVLGLIGCTISIQRHEGACSVHEAHASGPANWTVPEHLLRLQYDFDTIETLSARPRGDFTDPLPSQDVIENATRGMRWAIANGRETPRILSLEFACLLHRMMFGDTISEAGQVRAQWQFPDASECKATSRLRSALEIAQAQLNEERPVDQIALSLHQALAWNKSFGQGWAAHARAMADLVLIRAAAQPFTWGAGLKLDPDDRAERYRDGFRTRHLSLPLECEALRFARS